MDDDLADDDDALRVALAKAHYEVVAKRHLAEIASALVEEGDKHNFGDDDETNRLDALWRNANVGFDEATTASGSTKRARVATLAAKEVLEEKFGVESAEGHRKKRKARVGFDGENGHQQQHEHQRFFLQQFVLENEENARKLRRDVLNEEMSLLKWREARVKEKKKHAEKRMRIEESSGLPYVPELTKPTHKDVERFVRDVEEGLKKKEYAPTFREVLEQVRKVMEKQNGKLAVETAAAEYAMLHLGGAKYRAKKFALPRVEEEEEKEKKKNGEKTVKEEEEEEEEEEDEDEQSKKEVDNEKRREMQCEREFQIELEKSREANGSNTQTKGANANVITHERWEGRMNSTKIASKLENGSDIQTITYRDVIPNMNKVENVDWQKCGRLGERVVFNVLIQKYRGTNVSVKWVNENEESNAFYDIMLTDADTQSRTFIEVKATRFRDKNAFEISPWEWDFAVKPSVADAYQIWRVFGIGDGEDVQIVVINNPARLLREKKIGQALII